MLEGELYIPYNDKGVPEDFYPPESLAELLRKNRCNPEVMELIADALESNEDGPF